MFKNAIKSLCATALISTALCATEGNFTIHNKTPYNLAFYFFYKSLISGSISDRVTTYREILPNSIRTKHYDYTLNANSSITQPMPPSKTGSRRYVVVTTRTPNDMESTFSSVAALVKQAEAEPNKTAIRAIGRTGEAQGLKPTESITITGGGNSPLIISEN